MILMFITSIKIDAILLKVYHLVEVKLKDLYSQNHEISLFLATKIFFLEVLKILGGFALFFYGILLEFLKVILVLIHYDAFFQLLRFQQFILHILLL